MSASSPASRNSLRRPARPERALECSSRPASGLGKPKDLARDARRRWFGGWTAHARLVKLGWACVPGRTPDGAKRNRLAASNKLL